MAKIIINPTSSSRREIALARSIVSIGRDPSNDVVLPDAMVSRRQSNSRALTVSPWTLT